MGLKEQFLEKVKENFPDFNPETDKVRITFDGGGDDFNSFYSAKVTDENGISREGYWDSDEDRRFLFDVMDDSGIYYHWVSCNMNGEIIYANKRLFIRNTNCDEPNVWVDNYDEDGTMQQWGLTDSFSNVFGENSSLYNDSIMQSFVNFDSNQNTKKLLKELGDDFPWAYLSSKILPHYEKNIAVIDKIDGVDELKIINVACNGKTQWNLGFQCS
jgi:hypothetical protein